ncbi:MAG: serine/threonine-protein kinase [Isosphaeraceae bacterium]
MPSDSLPLTVLQEIDRVCDSFEAAWHAGQKPRIEDYLNVTTLEYRTELFGELLAREVELRKKAGESPEAADYAPRFACYGELILTVIHHSGQSGLTVVLPLTSTEDGPDAQPYGGGPLTEPGSTSARGVTWNLAASASNAPIVVPDRIGRFRVVRLLGRGNFLVFLAHDDQNDTEVAIKVARTGDSFSRRPLMSLAEEAQRLSALDHPGIVKIHEFVTPPSDAILEQEGGPGGFIVLEYVPGLNLEELFRQTSMAPARLAQIAAEIADAIHHAHMLGLVHRDLKPSNVLIDAHGHPRVCDFGLAIDEEIQRLRRGEVAGTLPYMAPEQVRGETNRLDGRTDIWALGVILYRGLTGRPPFRGASTAEYFDEILNREPRPPRQFSNEIPRELERICLRCLSRQMSDRYLTAADLAGDLRLWLFEGSKDSSGLSGTWSMPTPIFS